MILGEEIPNKAELLRRMSVYVSEEQAHGMTIEVRRIQRCDAMRALQENRQRAAMQEILKAQDRR